MKWRGRGGLRSARFGGARTIEGRTALTRAASSSRDASPATAPSTKGHSKAPASASPPPPPPTWVCRSTRTTSPRRRSRAARTRSLDCARAHTWRRRRDAQQFSNWPTRRRGARAAKIIALATGCCRPCSRLRDFARRTAEALNYTPFIMTSNFSTSAVRTDGEGQERERERERLRM